jgi:hypothetical protein
LPFVKVYKTFDPSAQFLDEALNFNKCATEPKTVSHKLAQALHATREDTAATVSVMMNYYKSNSLKQTGNTLSITKLSARNNVVMSDLESEISGSALVFFADAVGAHYEEHMAIKISDFVEARSYLVSNDIAVQFYSRLRHNLPTCHLLFTSIVLTKSYRVPTGHTDNPTKTNRTNSTGRRK